MKKNASKKPAFKSAAAKKPIARTASAPKLPATPVDRPVIIFPTVMIPQGNGVYSVEPGRPQCISDEIGTKEFCKLTGMSQRNAVRLCEEGLVQCRRLTPKEKSKYVIKRSEAARFRKFDGIADCSPEREVRF